MDAFGESSKKSPFTDDKIDAAQTPGRLLGYVQEAFFGMELLKKSDPKTPGKQFYGVKYTLGTFVGLICLSVSQRDMIGTRVPAARFIALSAPRSLEAELESILCSKCDRKSFPPTTLVMSSTCPCTPRTNNGQLSEARYSADLFYYDSNRKSIRAGDYYMLKYQEPPVLNVVLVQTVDGTNNTGNTVLRRLGSAKYISRNGQKLIESSKP